MSKGRILIVEDNEDNFQLVRFLLERDGFEVISAANGKEGVETAMREKPDLILMDLSMPEMDGWTAAQKIKAEPETKAIPLLALTAHTLPGDRMRALEAGCDGYISKPINVEYLIKTVSSSIGKARKQSD
jgi:two-component system cell cycle response regulator DivK